MVWAGFEMPKNLDHYTVQIVQHGAVPESDEAIAFIGNDAVAMRIMLYG